MTKRILVPLFVIILALSCMSMAQDSLGLKDFFKDDFLIGAAPGYTFMNDSQVVDLLKTHFNILTPENQGKWGPIHPQPDKWNFKPMDDLLAFADSNGIKVIGHTLVWHSQTPNWVFEDENKQPLNREQLLQRMQDHINTVMGRYKGKIYGYDVVNEAVLDGEASEEILRNSKWRQIIGDDFLLQAFSFAKQADPEAQLYYNDYDMCNPVKRDRTVKLIKKLQAEGAQIDGVGMQGHWNIYSPPLEEIEKSIIAFSELGVKVMITELDMSVFSSNKEGDIYSEGLPDSIIQIQTDRYVEIFKLFRKHADKIDRVTFWGTTDRYSWINFSGMRKRTNYPLLFDRNAQPKPVLFQIMQP